MASDDIPLFLFELMGIGDAKDERKALFLVVCFIQGTGRRGRGIRMQMS